MQRRMAVATQLDARTVVAEPTTYGDDTGDGGRVEIDGWAIYLREIGRVRRLTAAEELELGRRVAQGDRAALQRLVEANLRLVIAVARRYRHEGLPMHDLVQEGNIGLLRAA